MAQTTYPTPERWRTTLNLDALEQQHALPAGLLTEVLRAESNGNPTAQNSASGAAGLFQFMSDTAKEYGIDPYDPHQAAPAAAKMLQSLSVKYHGELDKTLAGYQWGQGRVDRLGLDKAPQTTHSYIASIRNALTPAQAAAADLDAFGAHHFPTAAPAGVTPADLDTFGARHFPTSPAAAPPAPAEADTGPLPTVRPNADPNQPATLEYPALPQIVIEKGSPTSTGLTGMNDVQLMQHLGYDPFLIVRARGYRPGMLEAIVNNPGVQTGTLGGLVHGLKRPFLALTQGVAHVLGSPADAALEDLKIQLTEALYQQTPHRTTEVPLLGQTDLPALAGTMLVPIPGRKGVLPPGSGTLATIGKRGVDGVVAGTVAGLAQPVLTPGTPGSADDTFLQQKLEQGKTGALVGGGTGVVTSTAGAVGNKAVNATRNLSPRYGQVEEALKAATHPDGTVNQRIFDAMLTIAAPGGKFTGTDKWEVEGLKKLMTHIQGANGKINTSMTGLGVLTSTGIVPPDLAAHGFTLLGLAKALYRTPQGRNWLIAAHQLQPGSDAMSRLVGTIGSELPRLMATQAMVPEAPGEAAGVTPADLEAFGARHFPAAAR